MFVLLSSGSGDFTMRVRMQRATISGGRVVSGARIPAHEVDRVVLLLKKTRYTDLLKRSSSRSATTLEPDKPLEQEKPEVASMGALAAANSKSSSSSSSSASSSSSPSSLSNPLAMMMSAQKGSATKSSTAAKPRLEANQGRVDSAASSRRTTVNDSDDDDEMPTAAKSTAAS